jgi:hypothetical protein
MCANQGEWDEQDVLQSGEKTNIYRFLVQKPEGKRSTGRTRHRWADNIKMHIHVHSKNRVIQNDCRGFNNLSYTIHLR